MRMLKGKIIARKLKAEKERRELVDAIENYLADFRLQNGGCDPDYPAVTFEEDAYWLLMNCRDMLKGGRGK